MNNKKIKKSLVAILIPLVVVGMAIIVSPQVSKAQSFTCDSGSLDTTCYVNTLKTLVDGETISGTGNLVIANGGELTTAFSGTTHHYNSFSIDMDGDVTIQSGGKITGNLTLLEAANLNISSGGKIDVTGKGFYEYQPPVGPGKGGNAIGNEGGLECGSGGGGYGGKGGAGKYGTAGSTYGNEEQPVDCGSEGGISRLYWCGTHTTKGGGAVKLNISDTLDIGGDILANGTDGVTVIASGDHCVTGGGSGGSIYIIAGIITGSGDIKANGGEAPSTGCEGGGGGGGGGGGRIATHYIADNFAGTKLASGGTGYQNGNNGTIYTEFISPIVSNVSLPANYTLKDGVDTLITSGVMAHHPSLFVRDADEKVVVKFNISGDVSLSGMKVGKSVGRAWFDKPTDMTNIGARELYVPFSGAEPKQVWICEGYTGDSYLITQLTCDGNLDTWDTDVPLPATGPNTGVTLTERNAIEGYYLFENIAGTVGGEVGAGEEEEAVPEFTTLTLIIAAVAGMGIYFLIRQRKMKKA